MTIAPDPSQNAAYVASLLAHFVGGYMDADGDRSNSADIADSVGASLPLLMAVPPCILYEPTMLALAKERRSLRAFASNNARELIVLRRRFAWYADATIAALSLCLATETLIRVRSARWPTFGPGPNLNEATQLPLDPAIHRQACLSIGHLVRGENEGEVLRLLGMEV